MNVICLPYAGGSARIFHGWDQALGHGLECRAVELAGRGRRYQHQPYAHVQEAVDDLLKLIAPYISDEPYGIFGHSMGALLAFELMHRLQQSGEQLPACAFVSGRNPPHMAIPEMFHALPQAAFIEKLKELDGTPAEVFEHEELLQLFLPIIHNDFKLVETYSYVGGRPPLRCPLVVFHGSRDSFTTAETVQGWALHTSAGIQTHELDGGHFFLHDRLPELAQVIRDTLIRLTIA
ncbi:thioesterase [Paenibacillus athensensis]|uniref:Thioesterase domain-containing protein n=1 Tax=Paenibacillus athensensis TaxID=1967502 RepID=A0A4Y8PTP1_9BACL|nr:alpha/beta fold hydrolase [Paenibacillus athensensis]MCD1261750.1 thioesterase [Paenibacillus athensensis]